MNSANARETQVNVACYDKRDLDSLDARYNVDVALTSATTLEEFATRLGASLKHDLEVRELFVLYLFLSVHYLLEDPAHYYYYFQVALHLSYIFTSLSRSRYLAIIFSPT
jgi:hypothetical protein